MISWEDFNYINKGNLKEAFEDMCRMFFNYYYFDNKAIFAKTTNNPGIEIEPINCGDKLISFQAKHFEKGNKYLPEQA